MNEERNVIIQAYEKLICDCKESIKNNKETKKNYSLLEEYEKTLDKLKLKWNL